MVYCENWQHICIANAVGSRCQNMDQCNVVCVCTACYTTDVWCGCIMHWNSFVLIICQLLCLFAAAQWRRHENMLFSQLLHIMKSFLLNRYIFYCVYWTTLVSKVLHVVYDRNYGSHVYATYVHWARHSPQRSVVTCLAPYCKVFVARTLNYLLGFYAIPTFSISRIQVYLKRLHNRQLPGRKLRISLIVILLFTYWSFV